MFFLVLVLASIFDFTQVIPIVCVSACFTSENQVSVSFNPTIVHIFPCHFQRTPVPILDVVLSSESTFAKCPGDMAVRMRKVLARPWVGVRVCHFAFIVCMETGQPKLSGVAFGSIGAKTGATCTYRPLIRSSRGHSLLCPPLLNTTGSATIVCVQCTFQK